MKLPPVVGFAGPQGAGKDTCGKLLAEHYRYIHAAFANPVRAALYALNPLVELDNGILARLQTIVDKIGWDSAKRNSKDLRQLMQRMGTEAGRDIHGRDCWIRVANSLRSCGRYNIAFTDVRFPNEVDFIKSSGGIIIYIQKDNVPAQITNHRSEEFNVEDVADFVIANNGTIADLVAVLGCVFRTWAKQ
jgi:dephospho-CoA kinase